MATPDYSNLISEIKRFVTLQVDYTKLTVVEKMAVLVSTLAIAFTVTVLATCTLFYLSLAAAQYLSTATGSLWQAHLIVGGFYVLVTLAVIIFRKRLIINPTARFLTRLFLTNPEK